MKEKHSDIEMQSWLETIGIDVVEVFDRSWLDSDACVIQVNQRNGQRLFLKQFGCSDKFTREVGAYETWVSDFDSQVPRLVCVDKSRLRLLISDAGDCCSWEHLSLGQQERVQACAGRFLRALHEVEFNDNDTLPIGDAILLRAQAIQQRVVELQAVYSQEVFEGTNAEEVNRIVAGIEEVSPLLNRFKRVPCHRDFWKRNWIWSFDKDGASDELSLRVIDFEHARPDLFVFDFMKNWSDCWLGSPQLEVAFWDGYERTLDADERLVLYRCGALHALQTIIWGIEHQQTEWLSQGKVLLAATKRGTGH